MDNIATKERGFFFFFFFEREREQKKEATMYVSNSIIRIKKQI